MNIQFGGGKTQFGPGIKIDLTGEEVAMAIYTYLMAHNVIIDGPATIRINGDMISHGSIYVDPSGSVMDDGTRWTGRGGKEQ